MRQPPYIGGLKEFSVNSIYILYHFIPMLSIGRYPEKVWLTSGQRGQKKSAQVQSRCINELL